MSVLPKEICVTSYSAVAPLHRPLSLPAKAYVPQDKIVVSRTIAAKWHQTVFNLLLRNATVVSMLVATCAGG